MSERENTLRALEFRSPEWIPVSFDLGASTWLKYGAALEEIVLLHPRIFPDYQPGSFLGYKLDPFYRAGIHTQDDWGCIWYGKEAGMLGQVVGHPLADWKQLAHFHPPLPREQFNWPALRQQVEDDRQAGRLTRGVMSITQGGFFDRMQFLRGMENLLVDFMDEPPELTSLIEMLLDYNMAVIRQWLEIGVDQICFHGDIGTQKSLLFSPLIFRKFLKLAYREMFAACRKGGSDIWYSSDGRMVEIVDDLIECWVTLHDPQLGPNSLEEIQRAYQGQLCALVDINAQVLPFWSPEQIRQRIQDVVKVLGAQRGGLMLYIIVDRDIPLESIAVLCAAVEEIWN
jgi:uroporphyrinogen decarboxylase